MNDENESPPQLGLLPDPIEARMTGLTAATVLGVRWTYMGSAVSFIAQLAFTAAISRILDPADFGLVALAGLFGRFASHFATLGTTSAVVQKPVLTQDDIRTSFTVSLALGFLFFALFWVISPLLADLSGTSELTGVLRGIAVSFIFGGFGSTAIALLRRNNQFPALVVSEIIAFTVGNLGIGLFAATRGQGVWSLVLASATSAAILSIAALLVARHSLQPLFKWSNFKSVYGFGSRVSVIGFFEFLGLNGDTFAVGRYFGPTSLGQYSRASLMVGLPLQHAAANVTKVLLPALSRIQADTKRLRGAYLSGLTLMAGLLVPMWMTLSVLARQVVEVVLGPGWELAAKLLPFVGIAQVVEMMTRLPAVTAEAMGLLTRKLVIQLIHLALIVILVSTVILLDYEIIMLALAWAVGEAIRFALYLGLMRRELGGSYRALVRILIETVLLAAAVGLAAKGASYLFGIWETSALAQGVAGGLSAGCTYGTILWACKGLQIRQEISRRNLMKLFLSKKSI